METYIIKVNGVTYEVEVEKKGAGASAAQPAASAAAPAPAAPVQTASAEGEGEAVTTGTAGKVWKISAKVGDNLKKGDTILILEAMKMEIPVVAPKDGQLTSITAAEGDSVESGQSVATIA
ncbi:biotin/lipoyl-containing protein [Anaerovoracaceae bacterium 41-7]